MAKVFISYQSDDRPVVTLLAGALIQAGHSVWWDRGLGGDEEWRKQIEEQLVGCEVVLAVWTRKALDSRWVYSEADDGDKDGRLVQVTLDGTTPPKPFNRLQCLDLLAWNGDSADPRLAAVRDAIERTSLKRSGGAIADRALPDNTPAERSWMLIHDSLEPESYRAFLQKHASSPQASFARKNLEQLEEFHLLDRSNPTQIADFIYSGPFMALGAVAKEAHANAIENGAAMRFRRQLPRHVKGHVLEDSKVERGSLSATYKLPNHAELLRASAESVSTAARYASFASTLHITLSKWSGEGGAEGWLRWEREFNAKNMPRKVVSVETLDSLPALIEVEPKNYGELTPPSVQLTVLIGGKYLLTAWGWKPIEELRCVIRAFDPERVFEVCEGAITNDVDDHSRGMMRSSPDRPVAAEDSDAPMSARRGPAERSNGGMFRAIVLGAVLAAVSVSVFVYFDQTAGTSSPFWETWTKNREAAFAVEAFQPPQPLVARDDASNYRAEPFARDEVDVLAQTVAGETLSITGIVHQPDGVWYQVQLRDGRSAYLKASLAVVRPPERANISEMARDEPMLDCDLRPPGACALGSENAARDEQTQDRDGETLDVGDLY